MKTIIKYFLVGYFTIISSLTAQVPAEIENGIRASLTALYGEVNTIGYIYDVNKEKNEYQDWSLPITDPYGTLENCYLFAANVNMGGLIGIFKNNVLIWDSGPIVDLFNNNYSGYGIVVTMDLNNDSKVEIMANWNYGVSSFIQNVWVFSWDGSEGQILNETTNGRDENTLKSTLWSFNYVTEILDVEGDGIYEIKGVDRKHTNSTKLYSWNGLKYGDFGLTMPEYIPMNLLTAKVSCKVTKSQYGLLYNYTVENDSASKQKIWLFAVDRFSENTFINSGTPNKKWGQRYPDIPIKLIQWDVSEDLEDFPFDNIVPGMERTNYREETDAKTITISYFYIQGENGKKLYDNDYIQINSFKGKTICGKPAPDMLIYTDFLDTLIIYTDSSYVLGWIQNEQTRDKYDNYFTNAKNYLNQNNNSSAKSELQKVLTDCNADSSSVLTSEAYALLYFNTDYLIEQLPDTEPGLPVKLEDSQGNLLQGGSLQYYDSGWKNAIDNGDGTFTVQTEKSTVSLKMYYAGGNQQLNNIIVGPDTAVFQTVNTIVKLLNSQGAAIDTGAVKYYASGWKDLDATVNGVASKELLPRQYTFRMNYGGASLDKKQDIGVDPTVVFQTVNAKVQLKDSQGNLLSGGTVQYYASGWKDFGDAVNGEVTKELLPKEYSFRMSYGGASKDKRESGDKTEVEHKYWKRS